MFRLEIDTKQFDRAMDKAIKGVDTVRDQSLKAVTRKAYDDLFKAWPVDTYWSLANHHIAIATGSGGGGDMPLEPATRPDESGALQGQAMANRAENLTKLKAMKGLRSVMIGNTVPYAPDVAYEEGLGEKIYKDGARAAELVDLVAEVGQAFKF